MDAVTDTGSRWVTTKVASGKVSTSAGNCSRCWGVLSTQRVPPRSHCSTLRTLRQVGVGGALVAGQIGVAPGRHGGRRLEEHGGEVDGEELNLLVGVLDRHLVHPVEVGQGRVEEAKGHVGAGQTGVGRAGRRELAIGQDRLEALPVGERAQGRVGGHQVVQVRGARPRQPADDDRGDDPLLEDLGVPAQEVLNQQAVLQQAEDEDVLLHDARSVEPALVAHGGTEQPEALDEVLGAEVLQAGLGPRRRHEVRRLEGDV